MICISCDTEHNEKFCPNCGEKAGVKKITLSSIIEGAFSTITNMDKGFLFNIKILITNPRKMTNAYILGKRKSILNPISFLIISISIYLIVESFLRIPNAEVEPAVTVLKNSKFYSLGSSVGKFIYTYFKYFVIFTIFLLGNSTKLIFRKYNYLEHIAISSFIIGIAALLCILSFLLFRIPLLFDPIFHIVIFLMLYRIFNDGPINSDSLLLSFTSFILFIIQLVTVIFLLGLITHYLGY